MELEDARRRSFDANALAYDRERPGYPEPLFDELIGLVPGANRVLEIGCGTGKATRSLLARGLRVTGVELGASLAAIAREAFAGMPFEVHVSRFEDWEPEGSFDLAVCAQAYHWLDPTIAGPKIARALAPGAPLACFWNAETRRIPWLDAIYDEHAPSLEFGGGTFPVIEDRLAQMRAWIERGGALSVVGTSVHPWTAQKSADAYVRLIDTFSEHHTLPEAVRSRLYPAIRAAIDARGGTIEREMAAYLVIARPS